MQENKIGGKLYRILIDEVNDIWDRLSFWTKASDVEFADGSVLEGKSFGHAMIERSKPYAVDDIAYIEDAPSWCMFKCTQAGTTADTVPTTYQTISSAGTVVTDGTAKFTVYDVRPVTSMSTSNYTIPTTGLVNSKLSNFLCSDGYNGGYVGTNTKYFYFDYDDTTGKYGWNERSDRTRNTFHPFDSLEYLGVGTSFNLSSRSNYRSLTVDDFICEPNESAYFPTNFGPGDDPSDSGHLGFWGLTSGGIYVVKNYDNSTGILTAYVNGSAECGANSMRKNSSVQLEVKCWLKI